MASILSIFLLIGTSWSFAQVENPSQLPKSEIELRHQSLLHLENGTVRVKNPEVKFKGKFREFSADQRPDHLCGFVLKQLGIASEDTVLHNYINDIKCGFFDSRNVVVRSDGTLELEPHRGQCHSVVSEVMCFVPEMPSKMPTMMPTEMDEDEL